MTAAWRQSLKAEIQAIEVRYAKEEKQLLALQAEETKEVEEEKKLLAKVKADEKTELAAESKALLDEEILATEEAVDSGASAFLKGFFK